MPSSRKTDVARASMTRDETDQPAAERPARRGLRWRLATVPEPVLRIGAAHVPLLALAAIGAVLAVFLRGHPVAPVLMVAATTLAVIGLAGAALTGARRRQRNSLVASLMQAAQNDPDPVLLSDLGGRFLAANPAAYLHMHKVGNDDEPAGTPRATIGPDDLLARWSAEPARVIAAILADAVAHGQAQREFVRPDGTLRLGVHRASSGHDEKAAERLLIWRLSASARGNARSTDMLGLPLLTLGPDDHPVAANAAFRSRFAEAQGNPPGGQPTPGPLEPGLAEALSPLNQGVNPVRLSLGERGGSATSLAFSTIGRDGQRDIVFLPAWLGADTHRAGPAMRHDFEDIPVALILIDADGRITETNRPARALMGLTPDETRYFWEVVEGLGRPVAEWLVDAREGSALNRPEVLRATLPAQETYVQIILRRATGPGLEHALVAVVSDATELKSLEARFVQSQKMQAIGQLAGGVAHDFNNLLTAISGHCDLLMLNRDHYDPDYNDLVQIHQNANRAAALVRQLLAFSRKQTLKPETLMLESLLEEVAHLLTRLVGERITLTLSHDPRIGPIRADRRQLEQVIMNLVVNARDAMPMGGEIRIETEALHLGADQERGRARLPAGDYAVIRVIDEGLGIAADLIDKIFEPFFTTKRLGEGTGLGLSTAYGIVKQMGGWIFASSTEGTGTEFSLYFVAHKGAGATIVTEDAPRKRRTVTSPARTISGISAPSPGPDVTFDGQMPGEGTAATGDARGGAFQGGAGQDGQAPVLPSSNVPATSTGIFREGGVVLLVEDEAPVRAFAARALRIQGYQVLEAENGEQALEFLEDPSLKVNIFVTDVVMPGIDGPGWVMQALVDRPHTPVVFVSGYTEDGLSAALARVPRAVFLGKPFALQELTGIIADQLAQ